MCPCVCGEGTGKKSMCVWCVKNGGKGVVTTQRWEGGREVGNQWKARTVGEEASPTPTSTPGKAGAWKNKAACKSLPSGNVTKTPPPPMEDAHLNVGSRIRHTTTQMHNARFQPTHTPPTGNTPPPPITAHTCHHITGNRER